MNSILPDGVAIAHPGQLYINGQWQLPQAAGHIDVYSPDTEQIVARVAEATNADMDAAVTAARTAFDSGPWPRMGVAERAAIVGKMAEHLGQRARELALVYSAQIGALASFAPFMAKTGTDIFANYARIAGQFSWQTEQPTVLPGTKAIVRHEPVGVVAAIAPWNVPYLIMAQKIAPALVAGCTVIMKPAPETPLEAYMIAEAAHAAGLPAGVLNLVPAHREAADYLVQNPLVDKISFTGSTAAGQRIATVAGQRIARTFLELGGKSAAIVLDDFPTAAAAKILGRTITALSGQVCATLSRAIVPAARHDEIAEAIAREMASVQLGHSHDPNAEMGPIAMGRQLERIEQYVALGVEEGATLVTGGKRPTHLKTGYFFEPTLFANVDNHMRIAREEIFGPVLCLIPANDLDHAIALANDSNFGLNAAVLTQDADQAYQVALRIRSGSVGQNGLKIDSSLPFGGFKQSGIGREGGVQGLSNYLESKTIYLEDHRAGNQAPERP